jgi:hypothetical protein
MFYDQTIHQKKQIEVIDNLQKVSRQNPAYSAVTPVKDFPDDPRLCLTSVHQIDTEFAAKITSSLINPLKLADPDHFYYSADNLHLTIKNVRVVNDPPHFAAKDEQTATPIFSSTIPRHHSFYVYYYRLLILSTSLALVGTTDPELDNIILDLDQKMNRIGLTDDKKYINQKYFFSNICLLRFTHPITPKFQETIRQISSSISFPPYLVNSVTLLVCNGVFQKRRILGTWNLKK